MKILMIAALLCAALQLSLAQTGPDTLSLDECLRRGLEASDALEAKRHATNSAQFDARAFAGQRKPSLALKGSYNYTSETQDLTSAFPSAPGFTPPKIKFGDGNIYDLNLTATIPLYAGGAIVSREQAARLDAQAQRYDTRADSLILLHSIRRAYFIAAGAQANQDAAVARRARLQRHFDELSSSRTIGVATEDALLAVEASLKSAESALLQAETAARNARLALGKLIGEPSLEIFPQSVLNSALAYDAGYDPELIQQRPEVQMLDARIEQRNRLRRASIAGLLPNVGAAAVYHYAKPGVDMIENEWMDYYTLGVSMSWTLWDFHEARSRAKSQEVLARSLSATRSDVLKTFESRALTSLETRDAARPVESKLRERLQIETRRVEMLSNTLAAGLASESQWLDAQDDLTIAELEWISSVVALRLAEADYLYAIGR
ncbi:TolC family protein [bacterium]|nr:TolC family protein [bacterium]